MVQHIETVGNLYTACTSGQQITASDKEWNGKKHVLINLPLFTLQQQNLWTSSTSPISSGITGSFHLSTVE